MDSTATSSCGMESEGSGALLPPPTLDEGTLITLTGGDASRRTEGDAERRCSGGGVRLGPELEV